MPARNTRKSSVSAFRGEFGLTGDGDGDCAGDGDGDGGGGGNKAPPLQGFGGSILATSSESSISIMFFAFVSNVGRINAGTTKHAWMRLYIRAFVHSCARAGWG